MPRILYNVFNFIIEMALAGTVFVAYILFTYSEQQLKELAEKLFLFFNYKKITLNDGRVLEGPEKILGVGIFGYVTRYKINHNYFAIKFPGLQEFKELQNYELEIIKKINKHPNIISYYEPVVISEKLGIVMDLMAGTVSNLLEKHVDLSWKTKLSIALQITKGLIHLHSLKNGSISIESIVHQDLNPENLLVDRMDDSEDIRVKISDFGLAREVNKLELLPIHEKVKNKLKNYKCPVFLYSAPEVVNAIVNHQESREPKSDIFSTGIILWELAVNRRPNRDIKEITKGRLAEFEDDHNKNIQPINSNSWFSNKTVYKPTYPKSSFFGPIIKECINPEIENRPTAETILKSLQQIKI